MLLLFSLTAVCQTNEMKAFRIPVNSTHYYSGKEYNAQQILTFRNDSTFHITVPNSGSCWTWGEYHGEVEVKKDTVFFWLGKYAYKASKLVKVKEVFIVIGSNTLARISPRSFMFDIYSLTNWFAK